MYYEEKEENGKMYWRNDPNGEWHPFTEADYMRKIKQEQRDYAELWEMYCELRNKSLSEYEVD